MLLASQGLWTWDFIVVLDKDPKLIRYNTNKTNLAILAVLERRAKDNVM